MLVTMKRQAFDSLDPAALGWACIEPTLQQVHGISPTVKSQVLAQLTSGQRALFLFRVLYDHVGDSAADLYCWVSYLLSEAKTDEGNENGENNDEDEEQAGNDEDEASNLKAELASMKEELTAIKHLLEQHYQVQ
jgi:hypothetical protein